MCKAKAELEQSKSKIENIGKLGNAKERKENFEERTTTEDEEPSTHVDGYVKKKAAKTTKVLKNAKV